MPIGHTAYSWIGPARAGDNFQGVDGLLPECTGASAGAGVDCGLNGGSAGWAVTGAKPPASGGLCGLEGKPWAGAAVEVEGPAGVRYPATEKVYFDQMQASRGRVCH